MIYDFSEYGSEQYALQFLQPVIQRLLRTRLIIDFQILFPHITLVWSGSEAESRIALQMMKAGLN